MASTQLYPLSLHDALPISVIFSPPACAFSVFAAASGMDSSVAFSSLASAANAERPRPALRVAMMIRRSEEHTSELQSRRDFVCRLVLEKKIRRHGNKINIE